MDYFIHFHFPIMAQLDDYQFMKNDKFRFHRTLWIVIYLVEIMTTIFIIITLWNGFLISPTVTSLESAAHPVDQIPFPGVGVCNINKISRRRAEAFAKQISDTTGEDFAKMLRYMSYVGHLYDFDFDPSKIGEMLELSNILERLQISVINLTRTLATPCAELLQKCRWRGLPMDCSLALQQRLSHDGFCCTFNYVKIMPDYSDLGDPVSGVEGLEQGLYLEIRNDVNDYFYNRIASAGTFVHIFVPTDYPDKSSGSLAEVLVAIGSEYFLEIAPTTVYAVDDVIQYPVAKRECLFDEERPTTFRGVYSQSDCNVDCRVRSMLALCQCIPFMIPLSTDETVCTLADVPCLKKYSNKWNSLAPTDDGDFLQQERQDSMRCNTTCYPSCDGTLYDVYIKSNSIVNTEKIGENNSAIFIYYGNRYSNLYKQDVVYYWFEILSNFGGIVGLMLGFSFLSIVEILLFCVEYVVKRQTWC